jgi:hypothetical protein
VVLFLLAITICNSSITAFSQIVLVGLGFDVSRFPSLDPVTKPEYRCIRPTSSQLPLAVFMVSSVSLLHGSAVAIATSAASHASAYAV